MRPGTPLAFRRIAVACSGLGHVQRGIEAWAADLGNALRRADVDVTLFGGGAIEGVVPLPCLKRTGLPGVTLARIFRHLGGWRYRFGSPYDMEQTSFALSLWTRIRRGYDILHVQDPAIAMWFELAHRRGLSQPKVIYANGTGDSDDAMRRFGHLQLLTRQAYDAWKPQAPSGQDVFLIPNFVDTKRFSPGDRQAARAAFDLPPDRLIVLCCAAIRRYHKRIDHLIHEFATALRQSGRDAMLVIAGGRETDSNELIAEATALLGDRVRVLPDLPRARMPDLYRAADLFTIASLQEMFGIVLIEAMATGLPVVCHDTPDFRSIVGLAGQYQDLSVPGGLADGLTAVFDDTTRMALAAHARSQVAREYAEEVVVRNIIAMYGSVLMDAVHG